MLRPKRFGRVNFDLFFDRQAVVSRLDRKERRILSGTGSFGRGVMRRSIRKAGKRYDASSATGPPRYHSRGFGSLKDGIFFQADLAGGSVVIGPNRLRTNVTPHGGLASSAQLIDEGGTATIRSFRFNSRERPSRITSRRARWRQRSFTEPSYAPTRSKMLELTAKVNL